MHKVISTLKSLIYLLMIGFTVISLNAVFLQTLIKVKNSNPYFFLIVVQFYNLRLVIHVLFV